MFYLIGAIAAAVGTNIAAGSVIETSPKLRCIKRAGAAGSAAIMDTGVDIFSGSVYLGTIYNTTLGAAVVPTENRDLSPFRPDLAILPNSPLRVVITKGAVTTNVLVVGLEIVDLN
jgi:hypothetical protein